MSLINCGFFQKPYNLTKHLNNNIYKIKREREGCSGGGGISHIFYYSLSILNFVYITIQKLG